MSHAAEAIVRAWSGWAVPAALAGAGLGAVALIADRLLPRGRCLGLRNALWLAVPLVLCLPPGAHLSALPPVPGTAAAETASPGAPSAAAPAIAAAGIGVWIAGSLGAALLLVRCQRRVARLWSRGAGAPPAWFEAELDAAARRAGLAERPRLRIVGTREGPAVVGGLRPVIVFPVSFLRSGPGADLGHALLHECLHLRRRDPLVAMFVAAIRILWWFHPAVHIAATRLAALREIGCDLDVARALGGRTDGYRRTLIRIAAPELLPAPSLSMGFFGKRSVIVDRIEALRRPPPKGNRSRRGAAAALFSLLIACAVPGAPPDLAPPEAAAVLPDGVSFADLQGCLQKRWFVTGLLAREEAAPRK